MERNNDHSTPMAQQTERKAEELRGYMQKADVPVPLYSWYKSKVGERLFCIVGVGLNRTRWVLEKGINKPFERPLTELQRLINEGNWVPFSFL